MPETEVQNKKTIDWCLDWIKRIKNQKLTLNLDREKTLKSYMGDAPYKEVEGRSKVVMTTLMDTINWVIPEILKIFCSGDEVILLKPRGTKQEIVDAVKDESEIINYQMRIRNNWFVLLSDVLNEACLMKIGIVKYCWESGEKTIEMPPYENLTESEYQAKLFEIEEKNKNNEFLKTEIAEIKENIVTKETSDEFGQIVPAVKTYDLIMQYKMLDEYPKLECVPAEDVGFPVDSRDMESIPFFYHRVAMRKYEVIKKYGEEIFSEIKELTGKDDIGSSHLENDSIKQARLSDLGGTEFIYSKEDDIYYLYECYYPDKDTGTPKVTVLCGDVIVEDKRNIYDKPIFRIFTPHKLPNRLIGLSFADLLSEMQKHLTMLVRQINDNIYFNTNGRLAFDENRVDEDELINNNIPGGNVPCRGSPADAILPLIPPQLQPIAFSMLEFVFKQVEYHSGISRAWQGVDPNAINPTFRGFAQQVRQAAQRIEMLARLFAEMLIAPLTTDVMDMNIKFSSGKTSFRLLNGFKPLSPDNLIGRYDVIVNVGIGTGNKDVTIMQMQQVIGLYLQLWGAGIPIISGQNFYEPLKELLKAMGYRNLDNFETDPKIIEVLQNFVMLVQNHIKQMAQTGLEMEKQGQNATMMIPPQELVQALQNIKMLI